MAYSRLEADALPNATPADSGDRVQRLMRWNADVVIQEDIYSLLLRDPRWTVAVRMLAVNMLAAAASDSALDGIFKDAGRYVAVMWAIHLHVSDSLTLPKLKAICTASGLLSPGRARALLSYLRYLDYIAVLPAGGPGEIARYVPTAALMAAWRSHLSAALNAARILEPAAGLIIDRLHDPAVLATFARILGEELLASTRGPDQSQNFYRVFLHRHAGTQIVWSLLAVDDEAFPPRKPIPLSIAATARRFRVSRIHVGRLLDEAEREGFLRRRDDGTVVFEEGVRSTIQFLYATQLVRLLSAAAKTIIEHPDLVACPAAAGSGVNPEPGAVSAGFTSEPVHA
ncbi:MAG: hypothetical protein JWM91_14 [Rhodospirillales bacterium]|nr:hypothetical protein [Rhodospirillales bacterium]